MSETLPGGSAGAPPPVIPDLPAVPLSDAQKLLEAVTAALTDFRTTVLAPLVQKADDLASNLADLVKRVATLEQAPAAVVTAPVPPVQLLLLDELTAQDAIESALGVSATNPNPPAV